jgi:hypothetical protein
MGGLFRCRACGNIVIVILFSLILIFAGSAWVISVASQPAMDNNQSPPAYGVLCSECYEPVYTFDCPGTDGKRTVDFAEPTMTYKDLRHYCAPLIP